MVKVYPDPDNPVDVDPALNITFPFGKDYVYRIVNTFGELIDKVHIFDDGLTDYTIELLKPYFTI